MPVSSVDLPTHAEAPPGRLIVRSPPVAGESALGWALRLAEANGYPNHTFVTGTPGHARGAHLALCLSERHIAHIAVLAGCAERDVECLGTVSLGERKVRFPGDRVTLVHMVNRVHPRVCPACLRDSKVLRAAWDLELWIGCPKHGCLMLDRCPNCEQPLFWGRRCLDRCCDRYPFAEANTPALSRTAKDLMCAFAPVLGEPAPAPSATIAALTRGMSLREVSTLIKHLGLLARHRGEVPSHEFARRLPFAEATAVVEEAARVLAGWPSAFHELIDAIAVRNESPARPVTFRDALQPVLRSFLTSLVGDQFEPYSRELVTYCEQSYGIRSAALSKRLPETGCWLPLKMASRRAGLRSGELARRLANGEVAGNQISDPRGKRWLVSEAEVQRLEHQRGCRTGRISTLEERSLFSYDQASIALGVSRFHLQAFVEAGLIQGGVHKGDIAGRGRSLLLQRDGVLRLLAPIADRVPDATRRSAGAQIGTLPSLTKNLRCDLVSALRLVLNSRVAPVAVAPSAVGLRRFLFSRDQLESMFRDGHHPRRWTVTEKAAVARMQISTGVLTRLVAQNFLRTRQPPGGARPPRPGARPPRLCSASVERFIAEHVTTGMLSIDWGMAATCVASLMASAGATQVARGCWRRADAERALGASPGTLPGD
jgi:hypothetical protein